MQSQIRGHLDCACLTMPASIHQDGYITNVYHLTFIKVKLCLFHRQCYAIIHTTAGSVTPWNIQCILMRNSGQSSSEIVQTKYRTGVNALQVLVYYFTIIRTSLSLLYNPFGTLSHKIDNDNKATST